MDSKLEKMARTGYVAKAVVYGIIGILTLLAALNMGGQKASQFEVIDFLEKQTFGNILLILITIGLLCYAGWRYIQSIKDPENIGTDKKGIVKRIAFFISGLIYTTFAGYALLKIINLESETSGGGGSSSFLPPELAVYAFAIVGLALAGTGIFQFKKAISKDYLDKFDYKSISEEKRRRTIKNTGFLGHIARGVIFLILAFFFLRAAYEANTNEIKGLSDAFSFIEDSAFGSWLLGLIAVGLIFYAIYVIMLAKYRVFKD